jgi:hypothetical protein
MNNYFRITGYCEEKNCCFIMDVYGLYDKLWQFSAYLISKGLKVLEVGSDSKFLDIDGENGITPIPPTPQKILLRANTIGKPAYLTKRIDGVSYKALKVADKIYIPDKAQTL